VNYDQQRKGGLKYASQRRYSKERERKGGICAETKVNQQTLWCGVQAFICRPPMTTWRC